MVVTLDEIERFKKEGNWKEAQPVVLTQNYEASAGGGNTSPVATLGDYNPNSPTSTDPST